MAIKMDHTGAGDITLDTTQAGELRVDGVALGFSTVTDIGDLGDVDVTGAANNDLLYRVAGDYVDTGGALQFTGASLIVQTDTSRIQHRYDATSNSRATNLWSNWDGVSAYEDVVRILSAIGTGDAASWSLQSYNGSTWSSRFTIDPDNATANRRLDFNEGLATSASILANDGVASDPSYSFKNNTGMGMYRAAASQLGFAVAGANQATMTASTFTVDNALTVTGAVNADGGLVKRTVNDDSVTIYGGTSDGGYIQLFGGTHATIADDIRYQADQHWFRTQDAGSSLLDLTTTAASFGTVVRAAVGGASGPSYSWGSDTDTGMYFISAGIVGFSSASAEQWRYDASNITSTIPYLAPDGAVGAPAFSFSNDTDTGLYSSGLDELSIAVGGSRMMLITDAVSTGVLTWSGANLQVNRGANASSAITVGETTTARGTAQDSYIRHYGEKSGSVISYGQLLYDGSNYQLTTSDTVGDFQVNGIDLRVRSGGIFIINTDDDATSAFRIDPPATTGGNTLITATGTIEFDDATQFDAAVDINSTLDVSDTGTFTGGVDITSGSLTVQQNGSHIILNANAVAAGRNVFAINNWDNVSSYDFLFRMLTQAATGSAAYLDFQSHNGSAWSTRIRFDGDAATNKEQMLFPQGWITQGASRFNDGDSLFFGTGEDLEIIHNGTISRIQLATGAGDLEIRQNGSEVAIGIRENAEVELYHDGTEMLTTQDQATATQQSGAKVKDWDGSFYNVGNSNKHNTVTGNITLSPTYFSGKIVNTSGTNTYTLADATAANNTDISVGESVLIMVAGGSVTFSRGTAVSLYGFTGDGTQTDKNWALSSGDWAIVTKQSANRFNMIHAGAA